MKLRTAASRGAGSVTAAEVMAFKLMQECEKKWKSIRGYQDIDKLLSGALYKDGVLVESSSNQEGVAQALIHNFWAYLRSNSALKKFNLLSLNCRDGLIDFFELFGVDQLEWGWGRGRQRLLHYNHNKYLRESESESVQTHSSLVERSDRLLYQEEKYLRNWTCNENFL